MNTKKTIAFFAIAVAVAFVASVGMASAMTEVPLYADQDRLVGTVTVNDIGTTITYATTDGWVLNATHLHVASVVDGIVVDDIPQTKKNNPIPGQFEYSAVHVPSVAVYPYTIPAELPGTTLRIAAHAKVWLLEEEAEETAWAGIDEGEIQFDGSNWATYFEVTLPLPEIEVQKEMVSPTPPITPGADVTYEITVTNTGVYDLVTVNVVDVLPGEMSHVSDDSDGIVSGQEITWNLGSMDSGDSTTITLVANIAEAGEFTNLVTVTGTPAAGDQVIETAELLTVVEPL